MLKSLQFETEACRLEFAKMSAESGNREMIRSFNFDNDAYRFEFAKLLVELGDIYTAENLNFKDVIMPIWKSIYFEPFKELIRRAKRQDA